MLQAVGTALKIYLISLKISDTMIDACYWLGKDIGSTSKPQGNIVKWVWRFDKDELLNKLCAKHKFSTRPLNLKIDQPMYIIETLSLAKRKLYLAVRQVKKDEDYKFLWVRGGKIFL